MLLRRLRVWGCVCACLSLSAAQGPPQEQLKTVVQQVADELSALYNMSLAIAYHAPEAAFAVAAGFTDAGLGLGTPTRAAQPDDAYVFGSITKMFTAPAVLQLVEQGVVHLTDPITKHVDPLLFHLSGKHLEDRFGKDIHDVQVQHCLHMTSGLADYDGDLFTTAQFKNRTKAFGPDEIILNYVNATLQFPAGRQQSYCSTNYILLGLLLARHFHDSRQTWSWQGYDQRTVFPKALRGDFNHSNFVLGGSCKNFTPVHGFLGAYPGTELQPQDIWDLNCLGGWTAGNYVGSVSDLARFTYDLYTTRQPKILSSKSQALLHDFGPGGFPFYGMGTFNLGWSIGGFFGGEEAYGHVGDTYGYQSQTTYFPAHDFVLTVGTNIETFSQAQPSDATCRAYHAIMAVLSGAPPPSCRIEVPTRFIGQCVCESSADQIVV